jgi:FtsH-binding integral membrane protein
MSYAMDYSEHRIAAEAAADARAAFIRKTYGHLAGAILAFVGLETVLINMVPPEFIFARFASGGAILVYILAFMGVSYLASYWAQNAASRALQYVGLALYVALEAAIFMPILFIAANHYPGVISQAGVITLTMFGGLTMIAFMTRHDFSYLRSILWIGMWMAVGLVIASIFIGTGLGLWFSFALVALACGFILYDTSNVIHHYRTDQYVAASLALFASVALLFYYVLRILMSFNSRD